MFNWLIFLSFSFSCALTLLGLFVDLSYQIQYQPRLEALHKKQKKDFLILLDQKRKWIQHPLFGHKGRKGQDLSTVIDKAPTSFVSLDLKKKILKTGDRWLEKRNQFPMGQELQSFFDQLENFDHFYPATDGPFQIKASDFVVMGQLYLFHSIYFSDLSLEHSLSQVRRLAKILISSPFLDYKRAGLSLLDLSLIHI